MGLKFKYFTWLASIIAVITNVYIYTYPSFNVTRCSWNCFEDQKELVQTDGDLLTKVTDYANAYFNDVKQQFSRKNETALDPLKVHLMAFGDPQIKGVFKKTSYLARLDIYATDYYLGHVYDMMSKRLSPSHIAVMGDLFSSQWIGDSHFMERTTRYMKSIYKKDDSWVQSNVQANLDENGNYLTDWKSWADDYNVRNKMVPMNFDYGYNDVYSWDSKKEDSLFINITGNHDIGYSGDTTYQHLARYNEIFGKDNYWIEYDADTDHAWRIVVLNSLLLEGPALQPEFLDTNWNFLHELNKREFTGSTVLLTHVPFYKKAGLCTDGPEFKYYPDDYKPEPYKANLLRSQNHLSKEVSDKVLNIIFKNGKPGVILTGHDHEGCETIYNKDSATNTWTCSKSIVDPNSYVQEITVRAMMGDYFGNTGLLTGQFDQDNNSWQWRYTLCPFVVQYVWWIAKISVLLSLICWPVLILL